MPFAIAVVAAFLIGGPIANAMGTHNPLVGVGVGVIAFVIASVVFGGGK
jgi:hypothetical protein